MIDVRRERLLTLRAAADWIGSRGARRPDIKTVRRWAGPGLRGVVLETALVGGVLYTSEEAIQRWTEDLTAASGRKVERAAAATRAEREHAAARAIFGV